MKVLKGAQAVNVWETFLYALLIFHCETVSHFLWLCCVVLAPFRTQCRLP
jgi:hypothetical protein